MPVVSKDQGWDGEAYDFYKFMFLNMYSFTLCACAHAPSQETTSRSLFFSFTLQDLGLKRLLGFAASDLTH